MVFILPFEQRLVPAFLGLFLITSLFTCSWEERLTLFKKRWKVILMFSSLYLLNIIGLLYTENMQEGLFHLEMQLSLLIVPLIMLTGKNVNKFTLPELTKTFVFGNIVVMVLSFISAAIAFFKLGEHRVFYYKDLSLFMHPGYFSMYANFAISLLISLIYHSKDRINLRYYLGLVVLIVGVYQLESRTGTIVLILNLIYGFGVLVLPRIRWKNQLSAYLLLLFVSIGIIGVSYMISKGGRQGQVIAEAGNQSSSFGSRLAMWKASFDIVADSPIYGVGTGDAQDTMQDKFKEERIAYAVVKNLNVHNQFFQVTIAFGMLGLLSLLLPMLYPLKFIWEKGNYLYVLFLGNVGVNFLTESVLEKQGGVIFYAVMWVLLYFTWKD